MPLKLSDQSYPRSELFLPQPTPEGIDDFQHLYQKRFGVQLTRQEALELATRTIHFVYLCCNPPHIFLATFPLPTLILTLLLHATQNCLCRRLEWSPTLRPLCPKVHRGRRTPNPIPPKPVRAGARTRPAHRLHHRPDPSGKPQESRSAKEAGREQFNRMLALIDAGEIDGIITWHPDRLSRNEMDAAEITMRVRKGILKDLAFVSYFFHNSPEGVMMLQMALCQSQYMVSKLATDVRRGLGDKVKKGRVPHRAPLGYLNDKHKDKGEKTISADPERFPLLRQAWDMLLTGAYSVPELQRILNED